MALSRTHRIRQRASVRLELLPLRDMVGRGEADFAADTIDEGEARLVEEHCASVPRMTNLFQLGNFTLASGKSSPFKIECDALTKKDWECVAYLLSKLVDPFWEVHGVPTGGEPLAEAMAPYARDDGENILIVDDVVTTGKSINKFRKEVCGDSVWYEGAVLFARQSSPNWIVPLFTMEEAA